MKSLGACLSGRCTTELSAAHQQHMLPLLPMAGLSAADRRRHTQVGPKRRRLQEDNDILGPVQRQEVQEATLVQRLSEYVGRIDTDMVGVGTDCALHAELHAFLLLIAPCVSAAKLPSLVCRRK